MEDDHLCHSFLPSSVPPRAASLPLSLSTPSPAPTSCCISQNGLDLFCFSLPSARIANTPPRPAKLVYFCMEGGVTGEQTQRRKPMRRAL